MEADDIIRFGKARIKAVIEHSLCTCADFFGGLQDHHQGTGPFAPVGDKLPRCADPCGHVRIMTAGVHDARLGTRLADAALFGGIRKPCLFLHRQSVHVGTDHHDRAGAVFKDSNNARLADLFGYIKTQSARLCSKLFCRAKFLKAEFGIGVQVAIDFHQRRHILCNRLAQCIGTHRRGDRQCKCSAK